MKSFGELVPLATLSRLPARFAAARRLRGWEREPRLIAIMHVPKTAGTALKEIVRRATHPRRIVTGFDRSVFGDFTAFSSFAPSLRRTIHEAADLGEAELMAGHIAFSSLRAAGPTAEMVTTLREPRSRLLSHWLFWRGQTDEQLVPWGEWAARVRVGREPLRSFLSDRDLACQTDNLFVRMLLWPDPLIPSDEFIPDRADATLVRRAIERLQSFAFVDTIENPAFRANLEAWLGARTEARRVNETTFVPRNLRSSLTRELNSEAVELLEERTRLDAAVWRRIATERMQTGDVDLLCDRSFRTNVVRYAKLMGA